MSALSYAGLYTETSMTNHASMVADIKAALEAKGQTFTTNEDAFQITARVAWALKWEGAQLVTKTAAQNGAVYHGVKYSHDVIAFPDGWVDCLANAGPPSNENRPAWTATGRSDAPLVAPFDLDASAWPPAPDVPPPLSPPDVSDIAADIMGLSFHVQALDLAIKQQGEQLENIRLRQQRGLRGQLFGYTITLTPP